MNWTDLLSALGLVLVLEGIMPFLNPDGTRRTMAMIARADSRTLRTLGFICMAVGLVILYVVRG